MSKWGVLLLFALITLLAANGLAQDELEFSKSYGGISKKLPKPYKIIGKAYCDTCRCGFETNVTRYIPGATVGLHCMDKSGSKIVYKDVVVTNKKGRFTFTVSQDHGDQSCDVVLIRSPWKRCNTIDPGRGRSRVIVTNYNGISSYRRHANNMGFFADEALPGCNKLLHYYLHSDE